jgi:cbb3-type cytochrome oxidase subunit 1
MRAGSGVIYLLSLFIFIYNIIKTVQNGTATSEAVRATGAV